MNWNGWIRPAAVAAVVLGGACQATAAVISVGTRIPISPTTFAVPIEIADAADVISWQFDLTYDATDIQVNTACDPFASDVYCSLFTGPVTEGNFFQSGAPFNLLNPGFVVLDPITLMQTGLLLAVQGASGGSAPFPSGAGVLAFVEFAVLGDGTSPITVTGSAVSAVPEPATLVLLTTGLLLRKGRRLMRYGRFATRRLVGLATLALSLSIGSAHAQTTAVGPYYAIPAWDQTLPSATRFIVLSNMNSQAVLDRDTGLVWQRAPGTEFSRRPRPSGRAGRRPRAGGRAGESRRSRS